MRTDQAEPNTIRPRGRVPHTLVPRKPTTTAQPPSDLNPPAISSSAGRPRSGSRRFALTFVPLAAAAIAIGLAERRYTGHTMIAVAPPSASSAAPPAPADLEPYCRELIDAAWATAHDASAPPIVDWNVYAGDKDRRLRLTAVASSRRDLDRWLAAANSRFQQRLEAVEQDWESRRETDEAFFAERQSALAETLALVQTEASRTPGKLTGDADPLTEVVGGLQEVAQLRQRYVDLRKSLREALTETEQLTKTPSPAEVPIDPDARREAYEGSVVLQQDLRQLQVRLAQVRAGMLEVWQSASPELDNVLANAERLSQVCDADQAASVGADYRRLLERLAETATEFHTRATIFSQQWTRGFTSLQNADVDPNEPLILNLHEQISDRVLDYGHEADGAMTSLRIRLTALTEQADEQARHHMLTASATRLYEQLRTAQSRFESATARLTSRDNYLLDAALHSARGLMHRSRATRMAIDAELEAAARQRLLAQRRERLADLDVRIDEIRSRIDRCLDDLLAVEEQVEANAGGLPTFLQARVAREVNSARRELLASQQSEVRQLAASARDRRLPPPVTPTAVRVMESRTGAGPSNVVHLATVAALAWSITFILMLAVTRMGSPARTETATA